MTVSGSHEPGRTTHVVAGLGWPGDDADQVRTERLGWPSTDLYPQIPQGVPQSERDTLGISTPISTGEPVAERPSSAPVLSAIYILTAVSIRELVDASLATQREEGAGRCVGSGGDASTPPLLLWCARSAVRLGALLPMSC